MSVETSFVPLDGAQLFTKTWIVLIPSPPEYIERYDHVFSLFAERGIKTFAWDQRGFGKSARSKKEYGVTGGTDKALEDIDHFVKLAKVEAEKLNIPLFIWGHSMGGALALMYAANGPEKDHLRGVISQAPLLKLVHPVSKPLVFIVGILQKFIPNFQIHQPPSGKDVSRDPELAQRYDNDPLIHGTGSLQCYYTMITRGEDLLSHPPRYTMPLLLHHGTADKLTSFAATKEFFEKLPEGNSDVEFKVWDGFYHELHNEPEEVRGEPIGYIAEWILKRSGEGVRARL